MRKFIKRYIAVFMAACVILGGWNVQEGTAQAATFSDINQDSVFLKQPGGSNLCTLVAATMMVRRGAMMNGNDNWASISTDMMRSAAWVEGIGLKWNFTCGSVTVAHDSFSGTAADLQTKLSEHPEGIVLYDRTRPHAVLLTDYTDGVFYCSDPSNGVASGRVPLSAASISIGGASCYWYITEDGNDDGLELLEEAVQAEEAAAETETAAETEVGAGEESSSQDWWTSLFG